ncbi:MAG: hypothetical protein L6R38_004499 [Xanthoria sp. 2 TBL-2021]|nr:MAG: hypothetical protein L6R38_004499 [Xanthoria sp. 2 TBL-2021]
MAHQPEAITKAFPTQTSFLTERKKLVTNTVKLLKEKVVIVIRAPPQCGKTTLLSLIAREILTNISHLEPVCTRWERRTYDDNKTYYEVLESPRAEARVANQALRETLKTDGHDFTGYRRPVYLIDDAENTYDEVAFWDQSLQA